MDGQITTSSTGLTLGNSSLNSSLFYDASCVNGINTSGYSYTTPITSVKSETRDAYVYKFLVPGVEKDTLSVYIKGDSLKIDVSETNEFLTSASFTEYLSKDIDKENVKSELANGILTVFVAKETPDVIIEIQ